MMSFIAVLLCFAVQAQIKIDRDYTRNGQRIIEFKYNGIGYSIVLNGYNGDGKARLIFKNLVDKNQIELNADMFSSRKALSITYNQAPVLDVGHNGEQTVFEEHPTRMSEGDVQNFKVLENALGDVVPVWPGGGDGGFEDRTWRVLGVTGGGTQSLAESRCNKVFSENGSSGCQGTVDCYCSVGQFICLCVCGEVCNS